MDEFDRATHSLTITASKKSLLLYFQQKYASDISLLQPASDPWGCKAAQPSFSYVDRVRIAGGRWYRFVPR